MSASSSLRVGLDAFCFKQFEATHIGPRIPLSTSEFLSKINDQLLIEAVMVDGYAPFCKHVFIPAFFNCPVSAMPISDSLLPLIRSKYVSARLRPTALHQCEGPDLCTSRYEARTQHELPVLVRYVPKELLQTAGMQIPDATVLDLILYSREQIAEEYKSMGRQNTESLLPDSEWSIISVKPQTESFETPMQPITMCPPPPSAPLTCTDFASSSELLF